MAICVFSSENIFALPSDKTQPIHVITGTAQWNGNANTTTLTNNVVITQGTTTITADKLVLYADKNNQVTKAVATGQLATYSTITNPAKPKLHAVAQIIEYYPPLGQVNLIGQAKVMQGNNSMTSARIEYNINNQTVVSPASSQSRVMIVIQPKELSKAKNQGTGNNLLN